MLYRLNGTIGIKDELNEEEINLKAKVNGTIECLEMISDISTADYFLMRIKRLSQVVNLIRSRSSCFI